MKKITLFLFALFTCWQINAQVSSYGFSHFLGTYTENSAGATSIPGVRADSFISAAQNIGFDFVYDGTTYNQFKMSSNGFISLNMSGTSSLNANDLSAANATSRPIIAPLWDDLDGGDVASSVASYELSGVAPNRVLTVEWRNWQWNYNATTNPVISFQVKLYETTNIIDFIYRQEVGAIVSGSASVGIGSATGSGAGSYLSLSNVATPAVSSTTSTNNINTKPATGQVFRFTPPVLCSGTPVAGTVTPALQNVCSGAVPANLVGTGYSSGVSGLTFLWEESNDNGVTDAWAPAVGGTGANTATYTPPAFSGTTIYYRLSVICANASTSAQTASVMVTVPVTPTNQITSLTIPAATVGAGQAVVNWTNGNGNRRVVYISNSATFTDPVNGNAPALVANNFYSGSGQQIIFDGTAATVTVSGLMPGTQYYIKAYEYVRCGSGPYDYYYNVTTGTNTGNFTTCPAYTVPYFEGFESGYTHDVAVAGCLSQASVTGTQVWTANSTFTTYNRTPRTGSYNAFLQYGNEDWLFIPVSLIGGTSYRVSLYARQDGATATNSNIAISYGTVSSAAGMTNAIVAATGIINGNYQEIVGDFTPATTGTYYVGIKGYMNSTPWYISLDDISITESPSCLNPNTIIASNITSNSVDLSWTDGSGGLQFDYEYVIQAPGTGEPTGAGAQVGDVSVIGEGFDIDGNPLTPNTTYEVYVRSDCGGTFSTWAGPITFRTLCETVTSFVQNFDGITTPAFPSCWGKVGATGAANTQTGSPNSTPNTLYMYSSSTSNLAVLAMQPVSNLGAGTHRLRMNMRANFTTNGVIEFGYLTDPNNAASFVLISSVTAATTTYQQYVITPPAGSYSNFPAFRHTGSPANSILIDDVVWEQIPVTPPTCATNVVATPHPTCGNYANSITWDVTSGAEGYYVTIGTTTGGNNIANAIPVSGTSYNFTGNFNTTYFYTIVPFNANGSATGCTEQSFATNVNGCYCVSAPTSVDGSGITNVQIVSTDFPNTVSTSPVYNDHTATPVTMSQGVNNNVQISFDTDYGYDYNIVIWIDANDDFNLDASEIVYTGLAPNTPIVTHNASFVMPGTMPLGQHRMRIVATDALQTPANPCYSGTYGETADFTVNIVAASCTPPAATTTVVPACGTAQYSIDVNVTALGSGTPSITDGTTTWPVSAIGVVNVGPFASGSSVTLTLLHGSDATCNLPLGSFNYACPPANDDCINAIALTPGAVFSTNPLVGTNAAATSNPSDPAPTCDNYNFATNGKDVWYTVTVPASGSLTVETNNNSDAGMTDTGIEVYSGTCGALTLIECDADDSTDGNFSIISLTGRTPGEVLLVRVWGYDTNVGTFQVSAYDASLSSGSFDNANFVAYPNPVKDFLNVSYTSEISSIRVINMIGQEVISKTINATSSQVDMSQLSAGTYIVNVAVGDAVKTLKVVKQ